MVTNLSFRVVAKTYVYIKMESSLRRCFARLIICLISLVGYLLTAAAETERERLEEIGKEFSEVLKYTDAKMWSKATEKVDTLNNSVAYDILQWLKLRDGTKDFSSYESFLLLNDDWPGIDLLRSKGELAIDSSISSSRILKYFRSRKPMTAAGALKFSEALLFLQDVRGAEEIIKQSWLEHLYSTKEITAALKLFGPFLEAYHVLRADNLLWLGQFKDAELMIPFLSKDDAMLVTTRIALQKKSFGVDKYIRDLPSEFKNNSGLIFDRFSYRKQKKLYKGAEDLLLNYSVSKNKLGKPRMWAKGRKEYARRALLRGDYNLAYKISSNHFIDFSEYKLVNELADLEWLAGFIAFEFQGDYHKALTHFQNFSMFVVNPINQAKASYWIGRSYEKLGSNTKMQNAFERGADYQTTFYGQLSAERANRPARIDLIIKNHQYNWVEEEFLAKSTIKAAILLYFSGRSVLADRFFNHVSESLSRSERLALSQLVSDLGLKSSGLSIAKTAGISGIYCPDFLFPVLSENLSFDQELKPLITSIIKQESGFFSYTKSSAGALGLMQVMPTTAKSEAKKLGRNFSKKKLLTDRQYNIDIGTSFLKMLLKKFDGSKILAISAYNAGPYRVGDWISRFGDPRLGGVDPLVWIESIPFSETRNYVKRVLEADWIYRGKFAGKPAALDMARRNFGHQF